MSHWETSGASDEWYTPAYIFDALGVKFDLDVAAPPVPTHVPAANIITQLDDGLRLPWSGFVWMNPPFGGRNALVPWLDKFFMHGNGIALTPDRTSAPWFRNAWSRTDLVLFTRKIRFIRPNGTEGVSPSNGTALWAVGGNAIDALHRAASVGLGILGKPLINSLSAIEGKKSYDDAAE